MPITSLPWAELGAAFAAFLLGFVAYFGSQAFHRYRYGDPVDRIVNRVLEQSLNRLQAEASRELHETLTHTRRQMWQDFQHMMERTERGRPGTTTLCGTPSAASGKTSPR